MPDSRSLPAGVRRLFRLAPNRDRLMRDDEEEMRFHLEMWIAEFRARGMSESQARTEAQRRFGDPGEYRNHSRRRATRLDRWNAVRDWLGEWRQDIRFALRHFRKSPAFTAIAVITLALGIGANTAIFSVVRQLLIAPLPYPNGDRIVALKTIGRPGFTAALASMSADDPSDAPRPLVAAWGARAQSLEKIGAIEPVFLTLTPDQRQDTVSYAFITSNFLDLLGARPSLGRMFRAEEESAGPAHNVVMISHRWWQRAYDGRADVLGKTIHYEDGTYTIVGVMPEGFSIPMSARALDFLSNPSPDIWLPSPLERTSGAFGLLRRGVSAEAATRELTNIAATTEGLVGPRALFKSPDSIRVRAMRPQDFLAPREVRTIEVLFAAVAALLLIACANVANLLLVRAWARRREFAVRMGLGAGRARLVRLALTESLLLALMAGALGVVIAWQTLHWIVALRPLSLDALSATHIDLVVLLWTAATSVVTGMLFGGAAAFFVSSRSVGDLLRSESRASSDAVSRRIRSTLIVAEIALSVALLVGAGLLMRSFATLQQIPLGFDPRHLVSLDILLPRAINGSPNRPETIEAVRQRLGHMPGAMAAAVGMLPTAGYRTSPGLELETIDGPRPVGNAQYLMTVIDSNYFRTSGIALRVGRAPVASPNDLPAPMPVTVPGTGPRPVGGPAMLPALRTLSDEIVINEALARRIAPDGQVIGRRIRTMAGAVRGAQQNPAWSTIVGVVDDVRLPGPHDDLRQYQVYTMPFSRLSPTYVVRFASLPPDVESSMRQAVQSVDATIVGRRARVADDYVREALAPTRFMLALLGAFALVAIVLAAVGLYGAIAYAVNLRTREIGIRIALGATPSGVVHLVVADGARLIAAGIGIGLMTAAAASRTLVSLLYGVQPGDPATFAIIALFVTVVAGLASYAPARRAAGIDPVDALRAD